MKNFIPLVLAVVLGLAAVLAVGKFLSNQKNMKETMVDVVVATSDIPENQELAATSVMKKTVPLMARPAQAIDWSKADSVVGQKAMRSIPANDYILMSDVGLSRSSGNIVGEREWAIAIPQADSGISKILKPGDEVAILGTFKIDVTVKSEDASQAAKTEKRSGTMVLFPKVRVVDVVRGRSEETGASEIIVALQPQQVETLIAAQRVGELSFALRRANDETNVNRQDLGIVDSRTFEKLLDGLQPVVVPKVPSAPEAP